MSSPAASSPEVEDHEIEFQSGDEYEETIRKQRAQNAALLASLDLSTGGSALVDPEGSKRKRSEAEIEERRKKRLSEQRIKAAAERKRRQKEQAANGGPGLRPSRASARLRGKLPAGLEEENKRIEEEKLDLEMKRAQSKRLLHQDHPLLALLGEEEEARKQEGALLEALRAVTAVPLADEEAKEAKSGLIKPGRGALGDETDEVETDRALAELQEEIDKMDLLAVKKATPKRLYTAAWHPSVDRELLFTGDKEGWISVWEPFARKGDYHGGDDVDAESEPIEAKHDSNSVTGDDGISWNLRIPQDSSPISCLKVPPSNPTKLFSSSYNSTLRKIDLEKGVSEQVFSFSTQDDDDGGDGTLLSVFDFERGIDGGATAGGDVIWCGDHRGGVVRIDLREPGADQSGVGAAASRPRRSNGSRGTNWQRWQLCEKKIGGLSLNSTSPHVLSVASLDQSIHLFDTRRLSVLPETRDIPTTYKHVDPDDLSLLQQDVLEGGAQLGWKKSKQASTSVDFSPDGSKLAAVSYDDVVKVWDLQRDWLDVNPASAGSNGATKKGRTSTSSNNPPPPPNRKGGLMRYFKKEEETQDVKAAFSNSSAARPSQPRPKDILSSPLVVPHNNQTGKWLTLFRVRWAPTPADSSSNGGGAVNHFTIGNMRRQIDLYSVDGKYLRGLYDEEWHSAVPAVCIFHPAGGVGTQIGERVMGGSASGRCVLWGRPREGGSGGGKEVDS